MIGNVLKELRNLHQKSQLEVCSALNIEQSTLANYENDKRVPKIDILIKLADYYNVSVDFLLGREKFNDSGNNCCDYFYEEGIVNWRIEKTAKDCGMSYEQILQLTEIPKERLDDIWFGNAQPCAEELIRFKKVLGVSIDYLLDESQRKQLSAEEELVLNYYSLCPDEVLELLESFCSLDKKQRTIVKAKSFELEEQKPVAADTQPLRKAAGK